MNRSEMQDCVLTELFGGLWHTTHPDRFTSILNSGVILPEPPGLADRDRWKMSAGTEYHSYVHTLGGVSLFDFYEFDPESYAKKYPLSSWHTFVPYQTEWACAVWIEIDREVAMPKLISGSDLVAMWKEEEAYRHTIMPYIEAAYLGSLPRQAFKRAFLVREGDSAIEPVPVEPKR
jgi:hypothetical protein